MCGSIWTVVWDLQTVEASWLETEGHPGGGGGCGQGTSPSVEVLDPCQSVRAVLGVGEDCGSISEGAAANRRGKKVSEK